MSEEKGVKRRKQGGAHAIHSGNYPRAPPGFPPKIKMVEKEKCMDIKEEMTEPEQNNEKNVGNLFGGSVERCVKMASSSFSYVHPTVEAAITATRTNVHVSVDNIACVRSILNRYDLTEEWNLGPFAFVTKMRLGKQKNSAKVILSILAREIIVENPKENEFWFEIGGKATRFGLQEFALVTGLCFGRYNPDVTKKLNYDDSRVYDRNFGVKSVCASDLKSRIDEGTFAEEGDLLKCIYIYVAFKMCGLDYRRPIPAWLWILGDNMERFKMFPWGSLIADESFPRWKDVINTSQANIYGYVCAFQWWVMEALPEFEVILGTRVGQDYPRCINWICDKKPQNITERLKKMKMVHTMLEPTKDESTSRFFRSFLRLYPRTNTSTTFVEDERRSKSRRDVGQSSRGPTQPTSVPLPQPTPAALQAAPYAPPKSHEIPSQGVEKENRWAETFVTWGNTFAHWSQQMTKFVAHVREYEQRMSTLRGDFNAERDFTAQRFSSVDDRLAAHDDRFTRMETFFDDYVAGRHSYAHSQDLRPTTSHRSRQHSVDHFHEAETFHTARHSSAHVGHSGAHIVQDDPPTSHRLGCHSRAHPDPPTSHRSGRHSSAHPDPPTSHQNV